MSLPLFIICAFAISTVSGAIGAILGLGGGVILVPVLTLGFGLDIRDAVGASIVSVIATSSGAAIAYLNDHLTNVRMGMLLVVSATGGSLVGALLARWVEARWLFLLFGVLLAYSALATYKARLVEVPVGVAGDALSHRLRLGGSYYDPALQREVAYHSARTLPGTIVLFFAGAVGGLLGIGAGALKVLVMDQIMRLPMKVASATSNFVIGVAAAASAAVYFTRGQIQPSIAAPVAMGVLTGALAGARLMVRLKSRTIRLIFVPVLLGIAVQMLWRGWLG